MQQDSADKSFDASPEKLRKARDKGQIARSMDLLTAASYTGFFLSFNVFGGQAVADFGASLAVLLDRASEISFLIFAEGGYGAPFRSILYETIAAFGYIFLLPMAIVLAAVFLQQAMIFTSENLKPKTSRISIVSNAKNKFGIKGIFDFFKNTLKMIVFVTLFVFAVKSIEQQVGSIFFSDVRLFSSFFVQMVLDFLFAAACAFIVFGILDYLWQRHRHLEDNKMSRKELMDELKESEGDPHMKQERKRKAQALASTQMIKDVQNADVVIVNPTHYAVALAWSREAGTAPKCIAKGVDEVALTIREVAAENAVPIHSDPPTARSLYGTIEVGQEVVPEFYQAVAAAIRFADSLREKQKARVW